MRVTATLVMSYEINALSMEKSQHKMSNERSVWFDDRIMQINQISKKEKQLGIEREAQNSTIRDHPNPRQYRAELLTNAHFPSFKRQNRNHCRSLAAQRNPSP